MVHSIRQSYPPYYLRLIFYPNEIRGLTFCYLESFLLVLSVHFDSRTLTGQAASIRSTKGRRKENWEGKSCSRKSRRAIGRSDGGAYRRRSGPGAITRLFLHLRKKSIVNRADRQKRSEQRRVGCRDEAMRRRHPRVRKANERAYRSVHLYSPHFWLIFRVFSVFLKRILALFLFHPLGRSRPDSAGRPYCHSIASASLFSTLSPRHISLDSLSF